MYFAISKRLEQNNIWEALTAKSAATIYMHWLNPLFDKHEGKG